MSETHAQPSSSGARTPLTPVHLSAAVSAPDQPAAATGSSRNDRASRDQGLFDQIEQLTLQPFQKAYLADRLVEELKYLGGEARNAQARHKGLRTVIVIAGVAITGLAGLNIGIGVTTPFFGLTVDAISRALIFMLGLLVTLAGALEGSFRWGEQWRHFRRQSELLRGEGWAFLELAGPLYQEFPTHEAAFPTFVMRIEDAIRQEVGTYVAQITRSPEFDDPMAKSASSKALLTSKT